LDKSSKELTALESKKADMARALDESTSKKEGAMTERDKAEDALTAATLALETADKNKASAEAALKLTNSKLLKAAPDQKEEASKAVQTAQAELAKAETEQKNASAILKTAKDERAEKQKELDEATKKMSEAATAVSNTHTLERNAKAFEEVIAQSKQEKNGQSEALERAKSALQMAETARADAARACNEWKLPMVESLGFSPDGAVLYSRHAGGEVRAWVSATGVALGALDPALVWELAFKIGDSTKVDSPVSHRVNALAFSPDGKLLVSGSGDPSRSGELKLWSAENGRLVREIPKAHKDAVLALDFSVDGKLLASGSADRAVRLWDVQTGKLFRNLEAHANHILSVSFRGDARRVASASADNTLKTWDIQRSDVVGTFSNFTKEVNFVRYIARGMDMFVTSASPAVRILQDSGNSELKGSKVVFAGAEARANTEGFDKFITTAAASPDGRTQIVGDATGVVRQLSPEGKIVAEWSR
jgi:chemotaxis protein histidine kinase CheA